MTSSSTKGDEVQGGGASLRDRATAVEPVPVSPLRDGIASARGAFGWNDAITFGKYSGLLVREVASFNPRYLAWAVNNLDRFELTKEARTLGQRQLNFHRQQSLERQNGWAWGFGRAVKSAASAWRQKLARLETEARQAAAVRAAQAIEARRAETGTGSVHESAVGSADAPESPQP